jgi:hypothetical protein
MYYIFKGLKSKGLGVMLAATLLLFGFPFSVSGNDELKETPRQDMLKRLEELEEQLLEIQLKESHKVPVTSFDSLKLDFGGFITQTFTSNFNGDSPDRSSFDQTNLEILIGADITENHRFFTAVGFLRQADLVNEATASNVDLRRFAGIANRVPLIIAWGQHTFSDLLDITYGRFITPWGIINREHFPPTLMNLNQPQFLRAIQPGNLFGGNTFTPNFLQGGQVHGSKYINNHQFEYFAYTGHFNGGGSSDFISGGRLQWSLPANRATLGGSYQNGVRTSATNNHYDLFGVDLKIDYKGFLLKSEYIYSDTENTANRESYYIQPSYRRGKWLVFYRYDFIDTNTTIENDASEQTEHIFGVNYFVAPTIRLRAEYVLNRFELKKDATGKDRDYDNIQLSITTSF